MLLNTGVTVCAGADVKLVAFKLQDVDAVALCRHGAVLAKCHVVQRLQLKLLQELPDLLYTIRAAHRLVIHCAKTGRR